MKVRNLMSRNPLTLYPDDSVGLAADTMRWTDLRHLPVVGDGFVIGIVSESDVLGLSGSSRRPVREIMKSPVETIGSEAEAEDAVSRMVTRKIGCLPVIERGRLVGIITSTDVLSAARPPASAEELPRVAGLFARDVMRASPATARRSDLVLEAAARMAEEAVRHLVVVDEQARVVGMLSDRDIRQAIGNPLRARSEAASREDLTRLTVGEIMADLPVTVRADAEVGSVARLLGDQRFGAVPVVDQAERILGIISYVDLLRVLSTMASP